MCVYIILCLLMKLITKDDKFIPNCYFVFGKSGCHQPNTMQGDKRENQEFASFSFEEDPPLIFMENYSKSYPPVATNSYVL